MTDDLFHQAPAYQRISKDNGILFFCFVLIASLTAFNLLENYGRPSFSIYYERQPGEEMTE